MGGDAEHEVWQHIIDNTADDSRLAWNLFMTPHHCSWTFFNDSKKKDEVLPSAETILSKQLKDNSFIIASSVKIIDDDNNPPCYQAKTEYKKRLKTKDNFLNTAIDNIIGDIPQPIVFKIDKHGKRKVLLTTTSGSSIASRPAPRAGNNNHEAKL